MNVQISEGYVPSEGKDVLATTVQIEGKVVTHKDRVIGYVWKGSRTYSPPTHRGSRIAKYHKSILEWHGSKTSTYRTEIRKDTRQEVVRVLLAQS